jgi:hypothetical protein
VTDVLTPAETLLREEFSQAWQHFRHLESMRSQYLAFAFTITLAALAAAIPLIGDIGGASGNTLLVVGVFVSLYCLIIGLLFFSVRKIRIALAHYRRTMDDVRHYFYCRARSELDYDTASLTITGRRYAVLGLRLLRLQTTSEAVLLTLLAIGGVAEATCTVGVFAVGPAWWHVVLILGLCLFVGLVVAAVVRFAWIERHDEFAAQAHQ